MAHVFSKGKGYYHIGCALLRNQLEFDRPVVIDAENTVSHGILLIDMLTRSDGKMSPRERNYRWSLGEMEKLLCVVGSIGVKVKPYTFSLLHAEKVSRSVPYPTDGVIVMWPGIITSRKMKLEKFVELVVEEDDSLATSDGDVVFGSLEILYGIKAGDIVETRMKLSRNGRDVILKPLFRRVNKISLNSTSAVLLILSLFGCVKRDDEARRREVVM